MPLIRPDWAAPPCVHALVTERGFGDMARGGPGRVAIREHVPSEPVWLRQVHGINVAEADVVRGRATGCSISTLWPDNGCRRAASRESAAAVSALTATRGGSFHIAGTARPSAWPR